MKSNHTIFFISYSLLLIALASCSVNKAHIDNELKTFYDAEKSAGCFTMLDNATGQITVYNMGMDTTRVAPGASFDIVNAMIALHAGTITDENKPIVFKNENDTNSQSTLTLKQAFHENNNAFMSKEVAVLNGKNLMQKWIDSLSYGNKNTGDSGSFWMNDKLKISPDEQLGLLKRLYFDQLPFRKSVQESVRNMMLQEDNSAYRFSYKTGSVVTNENKTYSWNLGWIEENRHVYFFVNLVKHNEPANQSEATALKITKNILTHYGFFKGLK